MNVENFLKLTALERQSLTVLAFTDLPLGKLSKAEIERFICALSQCRNMRCLNLQNTSLALLDAQQWAALSWALTLLNHRRLPLTLNLSNNALGRLDPARWDSLCSTLTSISLDLLDLEGNELHHLPISSWLSLLNALRESAPVSINLSSNELHLLSELTWKIFKKIFSQKLGLLNLQHNHLETLCQPHWDIFLSGVRSSNRHTTVICFEKEVSSQPLARQAALLKVLGARAGKGRSAHRKRETAVPQNRQISTEAALHNSAPGVTGSEQSAAALYPTPPQVTYYLVPVNPTPSTQRPIIASLLASRQRVQDYQTPQQHQPLLYLSGLPAESAFPSTQVAAQAPFTPGFYYTTVGPASAAYRSNAYQAYYGPQGMHQSSDGRPRHFLLSSQGPLSVARDRAKDPGGMFQTTFAPNSAALPTTGQPSSAQRIASISNAPGTVFTAVDRHSSCHPSHFLSHSAVAGYSSSAASNSASSMPQLAASSQARPVNNPIPEDSALSEISAQLVPLKISIEKQYRARLMDPRAPLTNHLLSTLGDLAALCDSIHSRNQRQMESFGLALYYSAIVELLIGPDPQHSLARSTAILTELVKHLQHLGFDSSSLSPISQRNNILLIKALLQLVQNLSLDPRLQGDLRTIETSVFRRYVLNFMEFAVKLISSLPQQPEQLVQAKLRLLQQLTRASLAVALGDLERLRGALNEVTANPVLVATPRYLDLLEKILHQSPFDVSKAFEGILRGLKLKCVLEGNIEDRSRTREWVMDQICELPLPSTSSEFVTFCRINASIQNLLEQHVRVLQWYRLANDLSASVTGESFTFGDALDCYHSYAAPGKLVMSPEEINAQLKKSATRQDGSGDYKEARYSKHVLDVLAGLFFSANLQSAAPASATLTQAAADETDGPPSSYTSLK